VQWHADGGAIPQPTRTIMPRGDKSAYTDKQKRQAQHIEESEKKSGRPAKAAARIAYATVNKQDGGGKKSGSGRKRSS
jgi:hypothetical protein